MGEVGLGGEGVLSRTPSPPKVFKVFSPQTILHTIIGDNVVKTAGGYATANDGAIELEGRINAIAEDGFHLFLTGCNANEETERVAVADGELIF